MFAFFFLQISDVSDLAKKRIAIDMQNLWCEKETESSLDEIWQSMSLPQPCSHLHHLTEPLKRAASMEYQCRIDSDICSEPLFE